MRINKVEFIVKKSQK